MTPVLAGSIGLKSGDSFWQKHRAVCIVPSLRSCSFWAQVGYWPKSRAAARRSREEGKLVSSMYIDVKKCKAHENLKGY